MGAAGLARELAVAVLTVALTTGCTASDPGADSGADSSAARVPDRLGGPPPTPTAPPEQAMDPLEKPIAARLAKRIRAEGLTLEYVDCPPWSGTVPAAMVCDGYVDGVVGEVEVELTRAAGGGVEYDAWLEEGILATGRLVRRLEQEGYRSVDCGDTPAYPVRVGLRLVCQVDDDGETAYVRAEVTALNGEVEIEDY